MSDTLSDSKTIINEFRVVIVTERRVMATLFGHIPESLHLLRLNTVSGMGFYWITVTLTYFVVRDAAVDLGRLGGVDDDERQLDGRVGRGRAALRLLALLVPLDEVLEGDLLQS